MNMSTVLARSVVARLLAGGVIDVVLAPGSRSAPLAFAFAAAQRQGLINLHIRIDERSAAFLALGLAKATGRPTVVACTSGSAVANFAPAVVEALHSGVPLVALTADRPPALRKVGANQVIDQVGFFGHQVRTSVDLTPLDQESDGPHRWSQAIDRLLRDTVGTPQLGPAPVHANLAFADPLVPDAGDEEYRFQVSSPDERARAEAVREPINYAVGDLGLDHVPTRGVVVVGDVPDPEISAQTMQLAQSCGWPLIAEPSANCATAPTLVPSASVLLADAAFRADHAPDLVVTVGRFGLSRPVMRLIGESKLHIAVWASGLDRPDPLRSAALQLTSVPREVIDDEVVSWRGLDPDWLASWQSPAAADRIKEAAETGPLTGLGIAHECWQTLAAPDHLLVASSRTVRNFEAVLAPRTDAPTVFGNRGTSGIDGLISTAAGYAIGLARSNPAARVYAVLGDLAFLHDFNGLLAAPKEAPIPLTIVVCDNNGGGIFSSLEQGAPRFTPDFEQIFGTPHGRDLTALARGLGVPTTEVDSLETLRAALTQRPAGTEVVVVHTADRETEQNQWQTLLTNPS